VIREEKKFRVTNGCSRKDRGYECPFVHATAVAFRILGELAGISPLVAEPFAAIEPPE
jgi:hypothetical protein